MESLPALGSWGRTQKQVEPAAVAASSGAEPGVLLSPATLLPAQSRVKASKAKTAILFGVMSEVCNLYLFYTRHALQNDDLLHPGTRSDVFKGRPPSVEKEKNKYNRPSCEQLPRNGSRTWTLYSSTALISVAVPIDTIDQLRVATDIPRLAAVRAQTCLGK